MSKVVICHDGKPMDILLLSRDIAAAVAGIQDAHCVGVFKQINYENSGC